MRDGRPDGVTITGLIGRIQDPIHGVEDFGPDPAGTRLAGASGALARLGIALLGICEPLREFGQDHAGGHPHADDPCFGGRDLA